MKGVHREVVSGEDGDKSIGSNNDSQNTLLVLKKEVALVLPPTADRSHRRGREKEEIGPIAGWSGGA